MTMRQLRHAAKCVVEPASSLGRTVQLENIESGCSRLIGDLAVLPPEGQNRFRRGDVIFSKLRPYLAKSLLVTDSVHGSGELLCMRPEPATEARYLAYLTLSRPWLDHANMTSYGTKMPRTSWEQMASLKIHLPDTGEQRRIADFLDDRVARIDQIIAARRTQMDHVDDALDAEWNSLGARLVEHGPVIPLRRVLASIVDGPFGSSLTSSHYTDEGTRVIRLGNIGKAAFRDGDAAFISNQYAAELRSHSVSPGDLLMAGLGDERWPLGRCAVAPEDLGPAIVKADCYRIRLDARVRHDFAAAYISSPRSRAAILLLSRGSTRARLNTDLARGVELPLVGLEMPREYLRALGEARSSNGQASRLLEGVVHRFREYKQSLITAAVTGELDVTTAGSGIPG